MEAWMIVVDEILEEIRNGVYGKDQKMPSENDLANKYDIPRLDIRLAYKRLMDMGYIYSIQGKGRYFKGEKKRIQLILAGNTSFTHKMEELGVNLRSEPIIFDKIDKAPKIYSQLRVAPDDQIYKIGRLRYINQEPVAIHISFVAKSVFKQIDIEGQHIKSMFDYYHSKGYSKFSQKYSYLSASIATNFEREVLECPSITPIIVIDTQCIDQESNTVLEVTKIIYRGDRFTYQI